MYLKRRAVITFAPLPVPVAVLDVLCQPSSLRKPTCPHPLVLVPVYGVGVLFGPFRTLLDGLLRLFGLVGMSGHGAVKIAVRGLLGRFWSDYRAARRGGHRLRRCYRLHPGRFGGLCRCRGLLLPCVRSCCPVLLLDAGTTYFVEMESTTKTGTFYVVEFSGEVFAQADNSDDSEAAAWENPDLAGPAGKGGDAVWKSLNF